LRNLAGSTVRMWRNDNHVTENSGTTSITSAATSVTVSHGLSETPPAEGIQVTPRNGMGAATKFWVNTITATTFDINIDVAPGGAFTANFSWQAEYKKP